MAFAEIQSFATGVDQPESEACGHVFKRNVRDGCSPIELKSRSLTMTERHPQTWVRNPAPELSQGKAGDGEQVLNHFLVLCLVAADHGELENPELDEDTGAEGQA